MYVYHLPGSFTVLLTLRWLKVHVYPNTPNTILPNLHFVLTSGSPSSQMLTGYRIVPEPSSPSEYSSHRTWTFNLPPAETIVRQFASAQEPIASYGKVLGDRSTLYKYLNPHLIGIITSSSDGEKAYGTLYLLDSVSGATVYRATVPVGVTEGAGVQATMSENWLMYTWFDPGELSDNQAGKGWRAVSVEFYEGSARDDKTKRYDSDRAF